MFEFKGSSGQLFDRQPISAHRWASRADFASLLRALQARLAEDLTCLRSDDLATAAWVFGKAKVDREDLAVALWAELVDKRTLLLHQNECEEEAADEEDQGDNAEEDALALPEDGGLAVAAEETLDTDADGHSQVGAQHREKTALLQEDGAAIEGAGPDHESDTNVNEAALENLASTMALAAEPEAPLLSATTQGNPDKLEAVFPEIHVADFDHSFLLPHSHRKAAPTMNDSCRTQTLATTSAGSAVVTSSALPEGENGAMPQIKTENDSRDDVRPSMNFSPQTLLRFLEGVVYMCPTHKRKKSLEKRIGKLAPWICKNVWLFDLSELIAVNRFLADLGYSEPGYYEVFIPFLSQRIQGMSRTDIQNTVDTYNKLRFTDDKLGGRQFFYRLGKRWQALYAKSCGQKAVDAKRFLTTRRGELSQRIG